MGQTTSPSESNETSHSNRPNISRFQASTLLYCIMTVVIGLLAGSVLNGFGRLPPYVISIASSVGAAITLISGILGAAIEKSLSKGIKGIWQNANRPAAILASILTVGLLAMSDLVVFSPSTCPSLGTCPPGTATVSPPVRPKPPVDTKATATAASMAATATAVALQDPYGNGSLLFFDPLDSSKYGHNWDSNEHCIFTQGTYRVVEAQRGFFWPCFSRGTDFSDFAYQITIEFIQGSTSRGGLIFRAFDPGGTKLYTFDFGRDGSYALFVYSSASGAIRLANGSASAFKTGLNQTNVIAVVASGGTLDLYVNFDKLTSVSDSTYTDGAIGVYSFSGSELRAQVAYTNATVWSA